MRTPRYFVKRTDIAVPLVPGLYKTHSIMRTLASLSHKIVRHRWLIHQLDIILTLVIIVLASGYPFLPSYSKGKLWNGAFVALNGTSAHCHAYRKYTGNLRSRDTSLLRWHQWCPHYIEVPLYSHQ